jgi:hypothetical protein
MSWVEGFLCLRYMTNAIIKKIRYRVDARAKESQIRIEVQLFEKVEVINMESKISGSVALHWTL